MLELYVAYTDVHGRADAHRAYTINWNKSSDGLWFACQRRLKQPKVIAFLMQKRPSQPSSVETWWWFVSPQPGSRLVPLVCHMWCYRDIAGLLLSLPMMKTLIFFAIFLCLWWNCPYPFMIWNMSRWRDHLLMLSSHVPFFLFYWCNGHMFCMLFTDF